LSRPSARERLLDAAVAVVRRDGAQALTLDAVAAEAGVSKGGLLYHFKSKRDLLDAMIARWLDQWQSEFDAEEAAGEGFPAAFVRTSHLGGAPTEERQTENGLLAAIASEPAVLAVVRDRYATWQDRVEREGSDPVEATVARLAADGLWLADLLGLAPPQGELRDRVLARLLELARHD
jgi:AcrR family transcriptional regulator